MTATPAVYARCNTLTCRVALYVKKKPNDTCPACYGR